ncbi:hypothetical protein CYMTET_9062, partial [Cymbomonas tetramitiformis]
DGLVDMTQKLPAGWERRQLAVVRSDPPAYSLSAPQEMDSLREQLGRGRFARMSHVMRTNLLLVCLTLAFWISFLIWAIAEDDSTDSTPFFALMVTYFIYFGWFVCFAGNLCCGFLCECDSHSEDLTESGLASIVSRPISLDSLIPDIHEISGKQAKLMMNVTCSHTTSSGTGKNRRTRSVTTYRDSRQFPTTWCGDDSDDPQGWITTIRTASESQFDVRFAYTYEMETPEQQAALDSALSAYHDLNKHRDTRTNVDVSFELLGGDFLTPRLIRKENSSRLPGSQLDHNIYVDTIAASIYARDEYLLTDSREAIMLIDFVPSEEVVMLPGTVWQAFAEICDAYGQAEVLKGPTAKTFPSSPPGNSLRAQYSGLSTLSAGSCVPEQPLALRSVVFEDCDDTTVAETVVTHTAKLPTTVGMHRVAHDDLRREIPFDGYECPVMDMTPTVYNFNTATMDSDETDDESATDTAEIAVAAEVVSVLPQPTDAAEIRAAVVPPPRQRISGGGRLNTLQIDRPCDGILPICFHGWLGGIRRRNGCCRAIGTAVVHRALPCHRDTTHTGVGGVPACSENMPETAGLLHEMRGDLIAEGEVEKEPTIVHQLVDLSGDGVANAVQLVQPDGHSIVIEEERGELVDTTGDGKVDSIGFDTTGDGLVDMTQQLPAGWERRQLAVVRSDPPAYSLSAPQEMDSLREQLGRGRFARMSHVMRTNLLLVCLTLAFWISFLIWAIAEDDSTDSTPFFALMVTYFIYFGWFVCFAGNLCCGFLCECDSHSEDLTESGLASIVSRPISLDSLIPDIHEISGKQAKLMMNVTCSHTTSSGTGKNRRTRSVTTYRDSRQFPTTWCGDDSDDPQGWITTIRTASESQFDVRFAYTYEMETPEQQAALDSALSAYHDLNKHRDTRTNVDVSFELLGGDFLTPRLIRKENSSRSLWLSDLILSRVTVTIASYLLAWLPT